MPCNVENVAVAVCLALDVEVAPYNPLAALLFKCGVKVCFFSVPKFSFSLRFCGGLMPSPLLVTKCWRYAAKTLVMV